ncbi:MAG: 50S ribosomal protein L11 methyltransferase [Nitratiruptor sp.]|nr:50S ribosomal protein L11 methyltransferase [Nitratiruptor sp.]NPA83157.1 50S ribosomal protein L11 methyltransferase [Campylobacterota bacterium]
MDSHYYEYTIATDRFQEEISSFLMDRFYNGIEEGDGILILRSQEPLDKIMEELRRYVASLEELFGVDVALTISKERKANIDWIEEYKRSVTPVEVGSFYIHPSWYPPKEGKIDITIDPALAFGSGHHETTRSCLLALDRYLRPGAHLLDVGCGSGILAIAAAKKGGIVDICDTDELAIQESFKNFKANGVSWRRAWVGSAAQAQGKYDIVTANIVADVLVMIGSDLKRVLKPGAILILSGIIEKYQGKVARTFSTLRLKESIEDGEWRTMIFQKDGDGEQETPKG